MSAKPAKPAKTLTPLIWTLVAGLALIALLFAGKGWIEHGAGIFLALAESGMAWCF
ncbi:hypothetical protein [Pararhizobium sp.]|uniref:hypothetical protein n=1 Tax=Pararhizobium sp. TaxID=1977563 RepID=UPI00271BC447|nr:hypothetical protein [Pararhizobium sp.]MDO9418815.1 hypothetical protein [Pararhizobium sp.]